MPAYYRSKLGKFLNENSSTILWNLAQANASARFPILPEAIEAWNIQLPVLRDGFSHLVTTHPAAGNWDILLEYPIPIIGKRIDAVLLAHDVILVIETKTGVNPSSAARQVDDYALNLACFHEHSRGKRIVPLVVSTSRVLSSSSRTDFDDLIEKCRCAATWEFGSLLKQLCTEYVDQDKPAIDPVEWDSGRFNPIPPIIDAAVALYSGMDVFEIGHACAAREDLDKTTNALTQSVRESKATAQKTICFTTGVPGAGKTLVGLNTVHCPEVKNDSLFLSGNGPLVRVIQEALIRDVVEREHRKTKQQAKLEVQAFIHNVHRFAEEYYSDARREPKQRVIVFDEAQRAWNAEQNRRKGRPNVSEPEMMLEIMDRHSDWAVIIALVGNGQEIHRGEAGLAEWGRALARFPHWKVCASPLVLRHDAPLTLRLFRSSDTHPRRICTLDALHLKVSTRSIRAQRISDWVDAVLSGKQCDAAAIAEVLETKPIITRDLSATRTWLNASRRGRTRAGLVASARAARLRADGLELQLDQRFEWEHWFLDSPDCLNASCNHKYCNDVRSSSKLEIAATQFEIQGLELDWVGVCWGEDLTWDGQQWVCRRFNDKIWRTVPSDDPRHSYLVNGYRVLLTRARQRMIIYVPRPARDDCSRLHGDLDTSAQFLVECGASESN
jgi:hypothetical protein